MSHSNLTFFILIIFQTACRARLEGPPCIMCVQYIRGDTMSTSWGYYEYNRGCSRHRGYHDARGGYHEYTGVFNTNQTAIWMTFSSRDIFFSHAQ